MTNEQVFALEVSKFASRNVLGVLRKDSFSNELYKLLNKQMILQVLSDSSCLEELSTDEIIELEGILTIHS